MSSFIKNFLRETSAFFWDAARYVADERTNEAVENEYMKGIAKGTAALHEVGVEDNVIISLLQKHWHIDVDDATEVLRNERTVEFPYRALRAYLTGQGLDSRDFRHFMIKNKVKMKLRHDPNLWKLTPAELIEQVKENE